MLALSTRLLVGSKRGVAAMTCPPHTHADALLDPCGIALIGGRPVLWLQSEAVAGEKGTGFLDLEGMGGLCGWGGRLT